MVCVTIFIRRSVTNTSTAYPVTQTTLVRKRTYTLMKVLYIIYQPFFAFINFTCTEFLLTLLVCLVLRKIFLVRIWNHALFAFQEVGEAAALAKMKQGVRPDSFPHLAQPIMTTTVMMTIITSEMKQGALDWSLHVYICILSQYGFDHVDNTLLSAISCLQAVSLLWYRKKISDERLRYW